MLQLMHPNIPLLKSLESLRHRSTLVEATRRPRLFHDISMLVSSQAFTVQVPYAYERVYQPWYSRSRFAVLFPQ